MVLDLRCIKTRNCLAAGLLFCGVVFRGIKLGTCVLDCVTMFPRENNYCRLKLALVVDRNKFNERNLT